MIREDYANGGYTLYTYNGANLLTDTRHYAASGGLERRETIHYDAIGRETARFNGAGDGVENTYDGYGNLSARYVAGTDDAVRFAYDALGRQTQKIETSNAEQITRTFYDNANRVVQQSIGNMDTQYVLDSRGNRIQITHPNNHQVVEIYDGLGRVVSRIDTQDGQLAIDTMRFDAYGNQIETRDANGFAVSKVYGAFGRLLQETDADGRTTHYSYDEYGRVVSEYASELTLSSNGTLKETTVDFWLFHYTTVSGYRGYTETFDTKRIFKEYDDRGRLFRVEDLSTGVETLYSYDKMDNRISERRTRNGNLEANIVYEYNSQNEMTFWHDDQAKVAMRYFYNASGQLAQVQGWKDFTDQENPGTKTTDLKYEWSNGQLRGMWDQISGQHQYYTYYSNGLRKSWDDGNAVRTYTYNGNGQVTRADWQVGNSTWHATWAYDAKGNVTQYHEYENGTERKRQNSWYNVEGTLTTKTENWEYKHSDNDNDSRSVTVNEYDLGGRLVYSDIRNYEGKGSKQTSHIWNNISYSNSGMKMLESLDGDNAKSAKTKVTYTDFDYDANGNLVHFEKSKDSDGNRETGDFKYNNDNQIVYRDMKPAGKTKHTRNYFYANGNGVGDQGTDDKGNAVTNLGTEGYNPVKDLGDDFPASTVSSYTANGGETLKQVAGTLFGNESLWFVLAEANGLSASETLKTGQTITIPNTVESGKIEADSHKIYSDSEIIGSTMPNVRQEPDKCKSFFAILIVVVVAIVATVLTAGVAGAFIGAALAGSAGAVATTVAVAGAILASAVAGAAIYGGLNLVQQGLFIQMGLQEGFDNDSFEESLRGGFKAGAFAAATAGAGQLTGVWQSVTKVAINLAKVYDNRKAYFDKDGSVKNYTGLALALLPAAGEVAGNVGKTGEKVAEALAWVNENANYISPWLTMAETAIRDGGDAISDADWVSAIGQSLVNGAVDTFLGTNSDANNYGTINDVLKRTVARGVGALALSHWDNDAAYRYFENSVANDLGNYLGNRINDAAGFTEYRNSQQAALERVSLTRRILGRAQSLNYGEITDSERLILQQAAYEGTINTELTPQVGLLSGPEAAYAKYDRVSGQTFVDADLVAQAGEDSEAAALLYGFSMEEYTHQIFDKLESLRGIEDFVLDEGALIGGALLGDAGRAAGNGLFDYSINIGGSEQRFQFIGNDAMTVRQQNFGVARILSDYQQGSVEYGSANTAFDPMTSLLNYYARDIANVNGMSLSELKDVDESVIWITEGNQEYFNSYIQRGEYPSNYALTPNLSELGEQLGLLDRGWLGIRNVFPGKGDELSKLNGILGQTFNAFGYADEVEQRLVYLPEGVSRDDAIKGYFRETGRLMSDETMAVALHAIDQAVDAGGNVFIDATMGYTESSLNLAALNTAARSSDDYFDESGDYVKFLVSGEMNPISSGLALPGAVVNYLAAATVDGLWDSVQTIGNDYAPRDARLLAGANILVEAAMSASGIGKAATSASKAVLKASTRLVESAKAAKYSLRSPFILNEDVIYRMNSNPIDFIKGIQNPLVKRVDNVIESIKRNVVSRIESSKKFSLTYSDTDLESIVSKGRALGLNDKVIEDLVYVGSRDAKRLEPQELIQQMDNYVNVVQKRGYPYKFKDSNDFSNFKSSLLNELDSAGIPIKDVRIQGSSLRTPNANDVDLAVFVDDDEFYKLVKNGFGNKVRAADKTVFNLKDMTDKEIYQLAKNINDNPSDYNATAKTFKNAMLEGTISSKSKFFKTMKTARENLTEQYPHLNIEAVSVMIKNGSFDLAPNLVISR